MSNDQNNSKFIYTYVHHVDEYDLCRMEMRSFFSLDTPSNFIISDIKIDPSRSPFIQDRLEVLYEDNSLENIKSLVKGIKNEATFKVVCLNSMDIGEEKKIHLPERRLIEREVGLCIEGEPELNDPAIVYGLIIIDGIWYFGKHMKSVSIWRKHLHKPHSYSTALSTRVARTVANIAVPQPQNIRAIDPCCGIGTVVIEALSMGINIEGRDINYNVCHGSRKNITYFGLTGNITLGPISEVKEHYDVAIIDLPYNLFTHTSTEDQFNILKHARRIADKVVVVTIETIDDMVEDAGFVIADRCVAKKQSFLRQILLCE